ncbi:unnamed protein product [Anisakis simplex]|uniref:Mediator of RNA polymerase II transcription subunit 25 n=1 Tax=Anisakis simplex TaxID=6269 RepID=A0A0M3J2S5_ANISI|nr:unnamed protein product [Anisakis simplex]
MEGALVRNPEQRGNLFSSQITLDGYVNFLKNAVESNKTLFMISTDPRDELPSKKLVGMLPRWSHACQQSAFPGLVRDYEVNSHKLAVEGVIPRPLPLNFASLDPVALEALRQAHSHGHSHNNAHAHSHGHSHDGMEYAHAFENHQQNQALPPPPPPTVSGSLDFFHFANKAQVPPSQTQQIRNNPPPDITTSSQPLSNDAAKVPTQPAPAPQLPKPVAQPQATNSQPQAGVAAALPTTAKTLQAVPSEAGAMPGDTPQMASGQQLPADNSQHTGARPALRNVQQPAGAQRVPQGNPPSSGGQSVSGGVPQPARGQPLPGDNLQPSGGQPVPEGTFQATNVQPITPDSPKTVIEQPVPGAASQPASVPQPVNPEVKPMGAQPLPGSINQRAGGSDQQVPNKVDNQSTGQQGQTVTHNANQQTSGQSLPANSHQTIGGANIDGGQSTNGESVQVSASGNVKNVIDGKEDPQLTASNSAQNVNRVCFGSYIIACLLHSSSVRNIQILSYHDERGTEFHKPLNAFAIHLHSLIGPIRFEEES